MSEEQTAPSREVSVNHTDLKADVGNIFFVWSNLETALDKALIDLTQGDQQDDLHGIARKVERWALLHRTAIPENPPHHQFVKYIRDVLCDGLEIRNRLAHGIRGWSLGYYNDTEAGITTELNEQSVFISLKKLRSTTDQLNYLAMHLDRITSIALCPEDWKHSDLYTEVKDALRRKH